MVTAGGVLEDLQGEAVRVAEVGESAARQRPVSDPERLRVEVGALVPQLLICRVDIRDVEADVWRARVAVAAVVADPPFVVDTR